MNFLWIEKYRPSTLEDIVLPQKEKEIFSKYVNEKKIPNLLLTSIDPGLGKTSLAKILVKETDSDCLFLNGNLDTSIDIMRSRVLDFCSSVSIDGNPKVVFLDECENLSINSLESLKSTIETFSHISFILTANQETKIPEPIKNRLIHFDFDEMFFNNKKEIMSLIAKRLQFILKQENISFNKEDLVKVIKTFYPSSRAMIKILQQYSINQELKLPEKLEQQGDIFNLIIDNIKNKDFTEMRQNITKVLDPGSFYIYCFKNLDLFKDESKPEVILELAKYQDLDSRARDKIITLGALCVELMLKAKFN
mgnify:CR=1 FL=1